MNRWFAILPIAALIVLAVFLAVQMNRMSSTGQGAEYRPDAMVGQELPLTVLPLLDGDKASDSQLDLKTAAVGKPMVLNLFASWCAPCRLEHPQLLALEARGIKVVGVAYKDDPVKTRAFLDELGDPFDLVMVDREGRAGLDLGVSGVPETFVVDAYGVIKAKISGPILNEDQVQTILTALEADSH